MFKNFKIHLFLVGDAIEFGTIIPMVQSVPTGQPIKLTCHSNNKAKWTLNDKPLSSSYYQGSVVFIPKATIYFDGVYKCHGIDDRGYLFETRAYAFVGREFICCKHKNTSRLTL